MAIAHNLGFPRIINRKMKKSVEAYWRSDINQEQLNQEGNSIQLQNWSLQKEAGLDYIPVGDFSWYDHVLDTSTLFNIIPSRFVKSHNVVDIDTLFCMARGRAPNGLEAPACEMTKWFDTNYHYIVPELEANQTFTLNPGAYLKSIKLAIQNGHRVKPVILGPLSLLWMSKLQQSQVDKLSCLDKLLPCYQDLFNQLSALGIQWVQIDEPILVLDLPSAWHVAFQKAYLQFQFGTLNTMLTTYFGGLKDNFSLACQLPVSALHIDCCSMKVQYDIVLSEWPKDKVLSLGVINGRNIWRANLNKLMNQLEPVAEALGDQLWIGPSCSLMHVPIDLNQETQLDPEIKSWLAFAKQKVEEIVVLTRGLNQGRDAISDILEETGKIFNGRKKSVRIHNPKVQQRVENVTPELTTRTSVYAERALSQKASLALPLLPTTTIGSFPQTKTIRKLRQEFKKNHIDVQTYEAGIRDEIAKVISIQEEIGLDVLVHGEAERNDMVEYFGELLEGITFTQHGWVQSYGSRCVKPPIIFGDISRPEPMTIEWSQYAQSLTSCPVKGMLTGPVTILSWSFVRDDQPECVTALQLALALRDEVADLESAGIKVIQIDEPAFRERLPLRNVDWPQYLDWAVQCFRVASCGVKDDTQIHTHMCYSEFNDIIESIAALDADVITLESSRSNMELLRAFEHFAYPNEIGPGVYDIHSPLVPSIEEMEQLLLKALRYIPIQRLWVNPDCGLKTRDWPEVKAACHNIVVAAKNIRTAFQIKRVTEQPEDIQEAS